MKKKLIILLLNLLIPFLVLILPSLLIRSRQGTFNSIDNQQVSLIKNKPFQFSFISPLSNFQTVTFDLKNPNLTNKSKIFINIIGPTEKRSIEISGSNIGDPSTVPFKFIPFSDPPQTKYQITISTDNIDQSGLYILADKNDLPVYKTFFKQTNFYSNFVYNLNYQINLFCHRNIVHNLIYFGLIVILNIYILKQW